jgi:hypothetical protein
VENINIAKLEMRHDWKQTIEDKVVYLSPGVKNFQHMSNNNGRFYVETEVNTARTAVVGVLSLGTSLLQSGTEKDRYDLCDQTFCTKEYTATFNYVDENGKSDHFKISYILEFRYSGRKYRPNAKIEYCINNRCNNLTGYYINSKKVSVNRYDIELKGTVWTAECQITRNDLK